MHTTLQQMRLYEAVARHGSFTRAAQEVNLSQPAVSIQVKRLEEQVGMPLFDSIGRTLVPTPAGEELLAASRDILGRLEALDVALDDLRGDMAGPLRVAAVTTAKYFMPHLMGAFVRRHPKVRPVLSVINRANLLERLAGHQDDLFITGRIPGGLPVKAVPFLDNVILPIAAPDHPLAGRGPIPLTDLAEQRILKRELGSGTRSAVEQAFEEAGLTVAPFMELGSDEAIKQAVQAGLGIGFLSSYCLGPELQTGRLVALDVEGFPLTRQWYAVQRANRPLSRAAEAFLAFMKDEATVQAAMLR
ncbi:LysR family transcriptional regulator [Rhodospira trueperi]|uniref:HTH-type transcriptional regulator CbbR n=1 Tax=Rhodospira trueperi TaxID=69960 RepID=A0A1G7BG42_9PROT|nr:LysR family transcriptional regulator [Rhodospira trueperi]SDE25942.1 DNA-binding transcriptional regulator, LysR family [Rhodospira trueperi]